MVSTTLSMNSMLLGFVNAAEINLHKLPFLVELLELAVRLFLSNDSKLGFVKLLVL